MADKAPPNDTTGLSGKADIEQLLADKTVPVSRKIELLDARERELRNELLRGQPSERAADRDDADAYHLLNDVLGALAMLREEERSAR